MRENVRRSVAGVLVCAVALGLKAAPAAAGGPDRAESARAVGQASAIAAPIEWHTRLETARQAALRGNRPLLLEFWADWCAPCRFMDANVYTDARVTAAMQKVLPVRIDVDQETVLVRRYGVDGMPTIVFADSRGNELFRYTGLLTVDQMLGLLAELPGDITRINQLAATLEEDRNDFAALEGLGQELRAARLFRSSNEYLERALRSKEGRQRAGARAAILLAIGQNHLELTQPADAERAFERARRDGRGTGVEPVAMLGLARALLGQEKTADARRVLEELTSKHPDSDAAAEAGRLVAVVVGSRQPES